MSEITLTHDERFALANREDLLAGLLAFKRERDVNWLGVLRLQPAHTGGGSTLDRKMIAIAMARIEGHSDEQVALACRGPA